MKKLFLALYLVILSLAVPTIAMPKREEIKEDPDVGFYEDLVDELGIIKTYGADELTGEILENRNGNIIIEKTIGIVLNSEGDGKILNVNDDHDYISYKGVENIKEGDIILTYFIYNPDTNYIDDILIRFDYVIDESGE